MYDDRRLERLIDLWLDEDIAYFDPTSQLLIDGDRQATFDINARETLVVAGLDVARRVLQRLEPLIVFETRIADGHRASAGERLARVTGPARAILTGERTALNILQRLSGVATLTAAYVAAIEGTGAVLVDTRKTTPGLRMLEKHAVRCGGGRNHRLGLDGGVMIKDNHTAVAGSITAAVARARAGVPLLTRIEVECDRLEQVAEALAAGADMIMLDNMDEATMREAVALVAGRVPLECSGGVTLQTIRQKALTGVSYISVGRITHSAPSVDIGLDEAG